MDWESAAEFVRTYFESHDPLATDIGHRYPFRRRFDHCLRCSVWARRIAAVEHADVDLCVTAALFHDTGKALGELQQDHAAAGAAICDRYLASVGYEPGRRATVVDIVGRHSEHARRPDATLEEKVVSDADLLDETGAIAIMWDAMACALEPGPSYDKAYERSLRLTAPIKLRLPERLHTTEARRIAQGRFAIADAFLTSLAYELGRSEISPVLG